MTDSTTTTNILSLPAAEAVEQPLRRLLADFSPSLAFICENKMHSVNCSWWRSFFGYNGMLVVDAIGKNGGLILFWKDPAQVTI